MIIVNMFIAVILENYSAANDDVDNGITDEDYDMFYEVWVEFDPESTMYIPYENVSELIDILEPPLQIAKPNKFKIVHMDIPVVRFTNPKTGGNNFFSFIFLMRIYIPQVRSKMTWCSHLIFSML